MLELSVFVFCCVVHKTQALDQFSEISEFLKHISSLFVVIIV